MDNSTTGGNDKRNWRERLGIGTNVPPRSAEESAVPTLDTKPGAAMPQAGMAKPAPRPQSAVKPAPMAPRAAAPKPAVPVAASPVPRQAAPMPTAARPAPPAPARPGVTFTTTPLKPAAPQPPQSPAVSPEGLANRLKAQREAAEKLAEQRIQMARQRAEAARAETAPAAANGQARPKFSFVDEDAKPAAPKPAAPAMPMPAAPPAAQVVRTAPPRPVLGGDGIRPAPPRAEYQPPAPPNFAAPRAPTLQPPYRPIDPVTGYAPPPTGRTYVPPLSQPKPLARPQGPASYDDDYGYAPPPLRQVRPQRAPSPAMARGPQTYADGEDIFETPARASRRAAASDYAQAYQDGAAGYDEYPPEKSSGPWWILIGALVALMALAGGYFYYMTKLKPAVAVQQETTAPVVAAPEAPAKVAPEQPAAAAQQPAATPEQAAVTPSPSVTKPTKKQIYDRIVGDKEITGDAQLVPVEETPVQPEAGTQAVVPDGQPQPAAAPPDATDQGVGDTPPLPLPPPPGDGQQGKLQVPEPQTTPSADANSTPAANESQAANLPLRDAVTSPAGEADAKTESAVPIDAVVPTPSEKLAEVNGQAAPGVAAPSVAEVPALPGTPPAETDSQALAAASAQAATPEAAPQPAPVEAVKPEAVQNETAVIETDEPPAIKAEEKTVAAKPAKAKAKPAKKTAEQSLGERPVVLVAPGEATANTAQTAADDGIYGALPAENGAAAAAPAPAQRKRTLADLFNPKRAATATTTPAQISQPTPQPVPETQVAVAEPAPGKALVLEQPRRSSLSSTGSGAYVVQLASFRSRNEADQEFSRIRTRHSQLISGLAPIVSESQFAGSTRYRLGLGPVSSRAAASQVCSRLISAGERDCVVTRQQ